ncbi:MAG TPA: CRISPR-associated helicase Cas3' [Desulfonatronum sp.]|nr:CRISPR-associated helicase Cas3' [Desulfonatronum sp.]
MNDIIYPFWGKWSKDSGRHHLLVYHCLDVAAVVQVLIEKDEQIRKRIVRLSDRPIQDILPLLLFFAALHDVGKFSPVFQEKLPDLIKLLGRKVTGTTAQVHHTELGSWFWNAHIRSRLESEPFCLRSRQIISLDALAEAAYGHHGKPVSPKKNRRHFRGAEDAATAFVDQAISLFLKDMPFLFDDEESFRRLSWLFSGLLVLADWIGSSEKWFRYEQTAVPLQEYWSAALSQAEKAVEECGVLHPDPCRQGTFHTLLPNLPPETKPTSLQAYALTDVFPNPGPQMHIFEDLTGSGKTEAALLRAHGIMTAGEASGLFFALPTMATANAMYSRMAQTYRALFTEGSRPSLMLSHGARAIHEEFLSSIELEKATAQSTFMEDEESGPECRRWLSDNRKKALLAPCGAGTLDQALLGVLPARHQCLRLLGLSRTVLIADEIHAYDEYTGKILQSLLTFLGAMGTSVILLTATLTKALRKQFVQAYLLGRGLEAPDLECVDFPLATSVSDEGCLEVPLESTRKIDVPVQLTDNPDDMFEALRQAHAAGACSCWIRNTVNDAVAAYERLLAEGIPQEDVILFHARFAMVDRLDTEKRVLELFGKNSTPELRKGKIVIGTQVLEQSLNLDWDILLSDLAPMDLMIQRAGRCHRFAFSFARPIGHEKPLMIVLSPEPDITISRTWYANLLGDSVWVYPRQAVLWRTAHLLKQEGRIKLPEKARNLMEKAYGGENAYGGLEAPEILLEADKKAEGDDRAKHTMAYLNTLKLDQGYSIDASDMRWEEDVRVPTRLGEDTIRLRLCTVQNGKISLWVPGRMTATACARSEVPVSAIKVKEPLIADSALKQELEKFKESMPDQGKYCVLMPLFASNNEEWEGKAVDGKGRNIKILYSKRTGIRLG